MNHRHSSASNFAAGVAAALVARVTYVAIFGLGLMFKLADVSAATAYIGAAGFPFAGYLIWAALIFEAILLACFASGYRYRTAALAAAAYVLFLAIAFHGPRQWTSQAEFSLFVDHFAFVAGLLLAAAAGPGKPWVLGRDPARASASD
jgi:uncharacterized membrane protein YphA (DoxX/SURF4 family)